MKTSLTRRNFITCLLAHFCGCFLATCLPIHGFGNDLLIVLLLVVLGGCYVPFWATRRARKNWEKKSRPLWRSLAVIAVSVLYAGEGWTAPIYLNRLMVLYMTTRDQILFPKIGLTLLFFIILHLALLILVWLWGRSNESTSVRNDA